LKSTIEATLTNWQTLILPAFGVSITKWRWCA